MKKLRLDVDTLMVESFEPIHDRDRAVCLAVLAKHGRDTTRYTLGETR